MLKNLKERKKDYFLAKYKLLDLIQEELENLNWPIILNETGKVI